MEKQGTPKPPSLMLDWKYPKGASAGNSIKDLGSILEEHGRKYSTDVDPLEDGVEQSCHLKKAALRRRV